MDPLVIVLTSENLAKLKRCIDSILPQTRTVSVVINTLDSEYAKVATEYCREINVASYITESNGKPGMGKNTVLDLFSASDHTHLIPVDGDDYLLPNAIEKLTAIIKDRNPDLVGLIDSLVVLDGETMPITEWQNHEILMNRSVENTDPTNLKRLHLHVGKIKKFGSARGNTLNRFVLINKKAASLICYDQNVTSGEDVKQSMMLKLLQKKGKIDYVLLSSKNIYMYDVTDPGACFAACKVDPKLESKLFWDDITNEQINMLQSFELECIYD